MLAMERKCGLVEGVQDQPGRHRHRSGSMSGLAQDLVAASVGQLALGRDTLPLRARGDSGQLVAGFFLIGFGKQLAKIGEVELLACVHTVTGHGPSCARLDSRGSCPYASRLR